MRLQHHPTEGKRTSPKGVKLLQAGLHSAGDRLRDPIAA